MKPQKTIFVALDQQQLHCFDEWNVAHVSDIQKQLAQLRWPKTGTVLIDGSALTQLDTAGAWLLMQTSTQLEARGLSVAWQHFSDEQTALLKIVNDKIVVESEIPHAPISPWLARVGKVAVAELSELNLFLAFIGKIAVETLQVIRHPQHIRWRALSGVIDKTGYQALPIIALLSFMIGVVISYQMGNQLRNYGANVFIVDLLGLSMLREFGPLLSAIMVAGRTGSAFTAQLGTMKLYQEVDALNTMGVAPEELLLIPRLVGLFIVLPLLTIWADIFGVFGGMVMANNMLDISWYEFVRRFQDEIPVRALLLGLGKAPVFAMLIGSIGCFQGMQVKGSAESVGKLTTRSVVLSIFSIIIVDAIFSILFSKFKL